MLESNKRVEAGPAMSLVRYYKDNLGVPIKEVVRQTGLGRTAVQRLYHGKHSDGSPVKTVSTAHMEQLKMVSPGRLSSPNTAVDSKDFVRGIRLLMGRGVMLKTIAEVCSIPLATLDRRHYSDRIRARTAKKFFENWYDLEEMSRNPRPNAPNIHERRAIERENTLSWFAELMDDYLNVLTRKEIAEICKITPKVISSRHSARYLHEETCRKVKAAQPQLEAKRQEKQQQH